MLKKRALRLASAAVLSMLPATAWLQPAAKDLPPLPRPEGTAPMAEAGESAYSMPIASLDTTQRELFALGHKMFNNRWAFFWFENAEFGRGPTSNAQACASCHANNGRGLVTGTPNLPSVGGDGQARDHHITVPFEPAPNNVVRLSIPGDGPHGGPRPDPQYGDQLQNFGVKGVVPAEGQFDIEWHEQIVVLGDAEEVRLRKPHVRIRDLGYGPFGEGAMTALRLAPPLVGIGLLEAVPEETIVALAARSSIDGIAGKVNRVWDEAQGKMALGRFGLKANHGSIREQVAIAFLNDLGLSTPVYPDQNCPPISTACKEQMVAGKPEITAQRLAATQVYVSTLAVPARRNVDDPRVQRGERLFADARCAHCHVPQLMTGEYGPVPQLSKQTIHPYTDLLLHDMGEGLADGRPDFLASGRDWRTPPLWGIGLSESVNGASNFLHDGRARSFEEAILWHGGEAEIARETFRRMPRDERDALIAFLRSL
ncbi:MAG TPA: di-heme oxidoredictase family protein [Burkholderiales bacterium]|nr:di-heme oxidoredictase family protein [Burkholderiales bacterium]